jgi:hypothetical protein
MRGEHPHDRPLGVDETDRRFLKRSVKPVDSASTASATPP